MEVNKRMEADLGFVRQVVRRAESPLAASGIYLLWAAIVLLGFVLIDFAREYVWVYWLTLTPLATVVSLLMGRRYARKAGHLNRKTGARYALHWAGTAATMLLAALMVPAGVLTGKGMGAIALLLGAFTYYMAAVHLDRKLMGVALVTVLGYLAVLFIPGLTWTIVGALIAIGLLAVALKDRHDGSAKKQRD